MKHNTYFDGNVQSLSLTAKTGNATVGVIVPGTYEFSTATEERMEIVEGVLTATVPGQKTRAYKAGQHFIVPANTKFTVTANGDVAYLCRYK
ncbi:MAG: pyrimidine/purine nucleoside phosphorylase [Spirochaetes bacterium]|nr:pyrimidine/purine nucleoside phosphorylase [Spirochaetota bacterium]